MFPTFNYANFIAAYPQFSAYSNETNVTNIYTYEALSQGSAVINLFQDTNYQYYWSCQVLAHILTIYMTGLTGRVDNATEGTVSGAFAKQGNVDSAWWDITTYGQACWHEIQKRGGATYISAPCNSTFGNPYYGGIW